MAPAALGVRRLFAAGETVSARPILATGFRALALYVVVMAVVESAPAFAEPEYDPDNAVFLRAQAVVAVVAGLALLLGAGPLSRAVLAREGYSTASPLVLASTWTGAFALHQMFMQGVDVVMEPTFSDGTPLRLPLLAAIGLAGLVVVPRMRGAHGAHQAATEGMTRADLLRVSLCGVGLLLFVPGAANVAYYGWTLAMGGAVEVSPWSWDALSALGLLGLAYALLMLARPASERWARRHPDDPWRWRVTVEQLRTAGLQVVGGAALVTAVIALTSPSAPTLTRVFGILLAALGAALLVGPRRLVALLRGLPVPPRILGATREALDADTVLRVGARVWGGFVVVRGLADVVLYWSDYADSPFFAAYLSHAITTVMIGGGILAHGALDEWSPELRRVSGQVLAALLAVAVMRSAAYYPTRGDYVWAGWEWEWVHVAAIAVLVVRPGRVATWLRWRARSAPDVATS